MKNVCPIAGLNDVKASSLKVRRAGAVDGSEFVRKTPTRKKDLRGCTMPEMLL